MSERDWISQHPAVRSYISEICGQVKAKDVHGDIEQEMVCHIEELAEEKLESGMSRDEAIAEALKHMGGAVEVGRGFHAVHRPKPEWSVIALIAGMIVIAVLALFAMPSNQDGNQAANFVKWICGGTGIALMIACYFVDYRRLLKWSWLLYGATIGLMMYAWLFGPVINGARKILKFGPFSLDVFTVSSYLLLIAIAGLLVQEKQGNSIHQYSKWIIAARGIRNLLVYAWIPSFLYLTSPSIASFIPYFAAMVVLLLWSGRLQLLIVSGISVLLGTILILTDISRRMMMEGRLERLLNWDNNYQTKFTLNTIKSGGMWGQGFAFGHTNKEHAPIESYSEMLFPNLVYSLGWVFGAFVIIVVLGFVLRTFRVGMRLHDDYGKSIVFSVGTLFAVRLIWNLLMSVGLVPVIGFDLPILNWSSVTIFEFAAAGLMLGIYRRRDMIGRLQSSHPVT
ncbi:FtsW/RodA/SpoVE family cell cycle protein [Paenibacillus soyae]|uniref:FtsW/RodA/SpoVE family cell cycle protein n=1 Tax=Paenibacillus soyae TaxID=2969249 RepID=A0A9X2S8J4_9BACL|nr:FtsW/RodA/SpoVE family cell cycle protein [Paenibacillus soyae]MCR2804111.1 FtsW/RodA/SpoVE family cell cycle protein [Paenibacillus soyae]